MLGGIRFYKYKGCPVHLSLLIIIHECYHDTLYFQDVADTRKSLMLTPVNGIKDQAEDLKQKDKAANDLFSTAVSRIRQPIE